MEVFQTDNNEKAMLGRINDRKKIVAQSIFKLRAIEYQEGKSRKIPKTKKKKVGKK